MGGPFILMIAGGLGWAWLTGRLKRYTLDDGIAAAVFLLGLRLLTTGKLLVGAALMAGSLLWAAYRRAQLAKVPPMPVEDARRLLGVSPSASLAEISDAHRRLITRVHPDVGGSAELARRVNVARDILIAERNQRTPRAS